MSKENENMNEAENSALNIADVSHSLFKLNSKVELLDEILERRGQITIRYIERRRSEMLKEIQKLINDNCG